MVVERYVREVEHSLGFYAANSEETLIRGVAAADIINTEDNVTSGELKKPRKHKSLTKLERKEDGYTLRQGNVIKN